MDVYDVLKLIKCRRSVRRFSSLDVEKHQIDLILDAAKWAPSAGNLQARDFILIKDIKQKRKIASAALNQNFIIAAPVVIVACANRMKSSKRYGFRGESLYCIQDTTASIQNMLLTIHSMGLSSCWVGAFDEKQIKDILKMPEDACPIAIIPVGYSDENPQTPTRSIEIHKENW